MGETGNHPRLTRRKAVPADVPFMLRLRVQVMEPHSAALGIIQSEEDHRHKVLANFENAEVLMHENDPVGILKVLREGVNWELVQIQLAPNLQGQGVGTSILRQLVGEAVSAKAMVCLKVLKGNQARRLYERLGFEVIAESESGFTMKLNGSTRSNSVAD